jgi:hypothetical protein
MSTCCNDPTEPVKLDPRDLRREQKLHGDLLRDLFTENPEKVMLRQLQSASTYLRELAALRAYYDSVRKHAISMLDSHSLSTLERIVETDENEEIVKLAEQQLQDINMT